MSKQVDERVVSMQFDNRKFEENVSTTMGTLDKLKEKLNFKGVEKGFLNIDKSAKKVDMSPLSKSVETVGLKFNALYSVADQALRNITNSAMNAGKRIVSALAIDPIKTGFQEYETQINSVQTILANTESKGSTLQDVNNALAELNTYADKTIYNFTEMTRNIGTFTAAGVDLDTSVSAIKGIANLAAVSGSNSQQASTAMYQLSQALASGTVKLMDWNSVVNAGMGGQVFQDSLKETARIHGVNIDAMIKKEGSFRETLKNEWLTADILTATLAKFTGDLSEAQLKSMGYTDEQIKKIVKMGNTANDAATKVKTFTQLFDTLKEAAQSGWTKSWELLIGDFGEAKELLTDISDLVGGVIGGSADKRNEVLMGGLSTGWKQLLNEGINDAAGFEEMVSNVAKEHGVDIASMIDDEHSFQDVLKQSLKDGTLSSDVLGESISKFSDKVSKMSAKELEAAGYTKDHVEQLKKLDENVKNGTVSMEEFSKLIVRPSGRELLIESLWNSIKAIQSVLTPIKQAFEEVFEPFTGDKLYSVIEGIRDFTAKLTLNEEQSAKLKSTFKGLFSVIEFGVNVIKSVVSGGVKLLGAILPIGDGLLDVTGSLGDFLFGVTDAVDGMGLLDTVFQGAADILKTVSSGIGNVLSSLAGGIDKCGGVIGIAKKIVDVIGELVDKIQVATPGNSIFDTLFNLVNGGIFTAIGIWLAKTIKSLSNFTENAGGFLEGITGILEGVGDALQAFTGSLKAEALKKIAISIGILAASLWVLSTIDPGSLTKALIGMAILFKMLSGSLSSLDNIPKGIGKASIALIGLSAAMLILSAALKIMSTMSWSEMGVGLVSLTVGLGALIGAIHLLPEKDVNNAAKAIKKLASGLLVYAIAMKIMASMSWQEMAVGLTTTVVGLGALVGAVNLLPKDSSAKASSVIALASSMVILGAALKIMSSIPWKNMVVGLGGMVVGLGALVGALHLLPKDSSAKTGSLLVLASAMVILGAALKILSSMPWQELATGLGAMAIGLGILVGALWLLPKDVAGKAASILILSAAMVVLGAALKIMGSMSWIEIAKGIAAIAGVLIVLGIAGYALAPVSGVLLAIGGAVALLGIGCLAAGAGLVLLATGLTALAAAIVGSVGIILAGANELVGVFTTIILSLVTALVTCIPAITDGLLLLLVSVLQGLVQYGPQLVTLLFDFVIGLIYALAEKLPELIQAGVDLLMAFFQGVLDALGSIDMTTLVQGLAAVGLFAGLIIALSAIAPFIPGAMLAVLGMGALVVELGLVLAAIGALAQIPGLEWLISEGGDFLQKIGTAIGQFLGGIVGGFAQGMTSALPQIGADLSAFMINAMPFIMGAKMIDPTVLEGVKSLAEIILLLTGASILEGLTSWLTGGTSIADFGKQLAEFGPHIADFADSVSDIDSEAVVAAANAGKMLAEMADVIPSDWGNNNLTNFSGQFQGLGDDLVSFSDTVSGKIDLNGLNTAVEGSKKLVEVAKAIPNDWGNNNLTNFGSQLEAFGKSIVNFSNTVASKTGGLGDIAAKIKEFISSLSNIDAGSIESLKKSLTEIGTNGIDGLISAFAVPNEPVNNAISSFISSISETINSYASAESSIYTSFYNVGDYAVQGFAKGITDNKADVTAAGTKLGNYALTAAKKAIDAHSPSREFMTIGGYVVSGFAKGITNDLDVVKKTGVNLGNAILEATQKNLGIHSPSIVFNKEVGRWIVKGIAEGIKKDMSAEEAAEKKAQNIVDAFSKKLNLYKLDSDIAEKDYNLWSIQNGDKATQAEKETKELEYLNGELKRNNEIQKLAHDEWQETVAYLKKGEVTAEAEKEAWSKYYDAMIATAETQKKISNINGLSKFANEYDEIEKAIGIRSKLQENWLKTDGRYADGDIIDARLLTDAKADLVDLNKELVTLRKQHDYAIANYAADSEEVLNAYDACIEQENKIADKEAEIASIQERNLARQIENTNNSIRYRDTQYEYYKALLGHDAKDEDLDNLESKRLTENLEEYKEIASDEKKQWQETKRLWREGKKTKEDVEREKDEYIQALTLAQTTDNQIAQLKEDAAEREREALEKQYDIASDNADLQYQIWEKTTGRKATGAEKDVAKLATLSQQLIAQSSLLEMARSEWQKAANKYGQSSNEAQQAYSEYLQKQLDIANIQNEISDINEKSVERQKIAQSEYKKYVEKYEKFYLKNGMTREDLERDAKLVSDYDPNKTVNTMIDKTKQALDHVKESDTYGEVLESFSSMGTSYVTAVNDGVSSQVSTILTTMTTAIDDCVRTIKEKQPSWHEAGQFLADGFIGGVESKVPSVLAVVDKMAKDALTTIEKTLGINSPSKEFATIGMYAVMGLAKGLKDNLNLSNRAASTVANNAISKMQNAISKISEFIESDIDTQPTIRPVLDLSDVESGATRLNAMMSRTQAMTINRDMSRNSRTGEVQNGANNTSNGNTYQFTQNNYSPKALSRADIYRQTKNQFAAMKEVLV